MRPSKYGFSTDDEGNCILGDRDNPNMKVKTDGSVEINGTEVVSASGDLTVPDDLTVTDDAAVGGDLAVTGNMSAANADLGSAAITGNTSTKTLEVTTEILPTGLMYGALADNTTLDETHSGKKLGVTVDAKTITLPATVVGMSFWIVNRGNVDGAVEVKISPDANDKIMGCGITSADNKDLINTKATAKVGDYVKLVGDGANGWFIAEMKGTWARE